jgi:hypothetical protein
MWIILVWHGISTEVTVKGVKQCCISNAMDGTNNNSCEMAVKRMEMSGMRARQKKALTMKIETMTPIARGK